MGIDPKYSKRLRQYSLSEEQASSQTVQDQASFATTTPSKRQATCDRYKSN